MQCANDKCVAQWIFTYVYTCGVTARSSFRLFPYPEASLPHASSLSVSFPMVTSVLNAVALARDARVLSARLAYQYILKCVFSSVLEP